MKSARYFASSLIPLTTLCVGQCCSLKIEEGVHRVWLCRVEGGVTVETLRNGRWQVTSGGCTSESATID